VSEQLRKFYYILTLSRQPVLLVVSLIHSFFMKLLYLCRYALCGDQTIKRIALTRPSTKARLANIDGVNQVHWSYRVFNKEGRDRIKTVIMNMVDDTKRLLNNPYLYKYNTKKSNEETNHDSNWEIWKLILR
jgi:hypothetical protein